MDLEEFDEPPATLLHDLYLRKRADLVRFFTIRLGDRTEAEDLVQEIYLKIMAMDPLPDIQNQAAYLYRIGSNLLVDRRRGQQRAMRRDREWHGVHRLRPDGQEAVDEPAAEDALDAKRNLARLIQAVNDLPPQCQVVFRLHKFEGLTHSEVAARLGISRSAVEKHMSTALKQLIRRLA